MSGYGFEQVIAQQIDEYRKQIEQHQRDVIALTGAIQALQRLQKEQETETQDPKESENGE